MAEESGQPKERPKRIWTWVAYGVGGAGLIGAVITGSMHLSKKGDLDCTDKICVGQNDKKSTIENLGIATNVLIGVTAAGAVAGTVLLFLENKSQDKNEASVAVTPTALPGGAGLVALGRF